MDEKLIGIDKQLDIIRDWLEDWEPSGKRALLLGGKPGTGKTSSVYKVADEQDYEVVEYNTSDERGKEFVQFLATELQSVNLFGRRRVFLLDEIDGMVKTSSGHGYNSKKAIVDAIKNSRNPVIMTANEPWNLKSLRTAAEEVNFYPPNLGQVAEKAKEEGVENFDELSKDFRQATMKKYGSQGYQTKSRKEIVDEALSSKDFSELRRTHLFDLLKRTDEFYGWEKFLLLKGIELADFCGRVVVLNDVVE